MRDIINFQRNWQFLAKEIFEEIISIVFPEDQEWAEPFRVILDRNDAIGSLKEAHRLLRDNIIQPELPTEVDYIRIMSLHKSKGLNADHVIITGCVEGIIPGVPDENQPFEYQQRFVEEQRRLFYVAISRTKQSLVLSSVSSLPRQLAHRMRACIAGGDDQNADTITSTFIILILDQIVLDLSLGEELLSTI